MLRRLDAPLGSRPLRYLGERLRHYGINTSHFVEESLPERARRSYPKELLAEAAAQSHSIREVIEYMGFSPRDCPYGHIRKKLDRFGIDTSHFIGGRRNVPHLLPREALSPAVASSQSLAGVLKQLGITDNGGSRARLKRSLDVHGIRTDHFLGQGHRRGVPSEVRKSASDILVRLTSGSARTGTAQLRRALDDLEIAHVCEACGVGDTWQGKRLVLEIDHINGDRLDNRRENLRYLCPSCHSQTGTFSNRRVPPSRVGSAGARIPAG
ncbi:HNH endonuclease [Streptomyces sp. NPDC048361]|uniref:HNH endonuclease signature motif containing protein n=1 Tax=Streptomyces sp. NPDC048361 TaxID=3154720 RepID=UPI003417438A